MPEIEGLKPEIEALTSALARRRKALFQELKAINGLEWSLYQMLASLGETPEVEVQPDAQLLEAFVADADRLAKVDLSGCKTHADRVWAMTKTTGGIVKIAEVTAALLDRGLTRGSSANLQRSVFRATVNDLAGKRLGPGVYRVNV